MLTSPLIGFRSLNFRWRALIRFVGKTFPFSLFFYHLSKKKMPEPTKEQIQSVFKKLKQNRYNKVKFSFLFSFQFIGNLIFFFIRHVLIVTPRIQTGLLFLLVFISVPIVLLPIETWVFILVLLGIIGYREKTRKARKLLILM